MQTQTNSSIEDYSTAILVGGNAAQPVAQPSPASGGTAPRPTPSTGPANAPGSDKLLIDWNQCPPDGTAQSRQSVLDSLASRFKGEVCLGISQPGGRWEQHVSRPTEDSALRAKLRSAASEAIRATQSCLFATASGQSSLVLQQLRQASDSALVIGFGTANDKSTRMRELAEVGVVVCVPHADQLQSKELYAALIAQTQSELQRWLQVWLACRTGTQTATWQRRMHFYRRRPGQVGLLATGVLLACMAVPLPYRPQRVCVVEPASKSFVASPIEGRIRQALVRPGDVVAAGQILAHLDDEQLRWRLASAESEYAAANKRRDTALATRAGGEMRLAQLEQERIALQIESLEQQLDRLELRSPVAGVVVQGDWYQSDGAPVARGDMLFEIAPMDNMRVDIHLSTDDLARIEVGQTATVRVDAAAGSSWSAKLSRIDPRGKVIDSDVVFEATIDVENASGQLRPGMKGTARLSSGTQSLGWLLFHRPAMWAMKKLAW